MRRQKPLFGDYKYFLGFSPSFRYSLSLKQQICSVLGNPLGNLIRLPITLFSGLQDILYNILYDKGVAGMIVGLLLALIISGIYVIIHKLSIPRNSK